MRRFFAFISLIMLMPSYASAAIVALPYSLTAHTLASAAQVQSDFSTIYNDYNGNINYSNVGTSGFYASQIIPTTTGQATFGGTRPYYFPSDINTSNTVTANALVGTSITSNGNISATNQISSATASISGNVTVGGTFSGSSTGSFTGSVTSTGLVSSGSVQKKISGVNYGVPFNANETSGSTNNHIEGNTIVMPALASGSSSCETASTNAFLVPFDASPRVQVSILTTGPVPGVTAGISGVGTTSAILWLCNNSGSTVSYSLMWLAQGE